jgi:hypothetical protein
MREADRPFRPKQSPTVQVAYKSDIDPTCENISDYSSLRKPRFMDTQRVNIQDSSMFCLQNYFSCKTAENNRESPTCARVQYKPPIPHQEIGPLSHTHMTTVEARFFFHNPSHWLIEKKAYPNHDQNVWSGCQNINFSIGRNKYLTSSTGRGSSNAINKKLLSRTLFW